MEGWVEWKIWFKHKRKKESVEASMQIHILNICISLFGITLLNVFEGG